MLESGWTPDGELSVGGGLMEAGQDSPGEPPKKRTRKRKKSKEKCAHPSVDCCQRVVAVVGDCKWCQQKFCMQHRLPEGHGCTGLESCRVESRCQLAKSMGEAVVASKISDGG